MVTEVSLCQAFDPRYRIFSRKEAESKLQTEFLKNIDSSLTPAGTDKEGPGNGSCTGTRQLGIVAWKAIDAKNIAPRTFGKNYFKILRWTQFVRRGQEHVWPKYRHEYEHGALKGPTIRFDHDGHLSQLIND